MARRVLVTGATGQIGRQLVLKLCTHPELEVVAFVRDADKAKDLAEAGAELAVGTYDDKEAVSAAQKGVDTLVLITPAGPDSEAQVKALMTPSKRRKVRKIVRVSALKADPEGPTDNTRQHGRIDAAIQKSGLSYTIVRPQFFLQNVMMSIGTIREDDVMYWGMGKAKLGMIDVRDIVDVLEQVIVEDSHENEILDLTGPASVGWDDVAKEISEGIGRPVTHIPVPVEAVHTSILRMGLGDWFAEVMRDYSKAYGEGWGDYTTDTVQKVTGKPARSVRDFVRDVFAPAFKG
jgi:uncharacterized protein YbjT (DUF2867 family)